MSLLPPRFRTLLGAFALTLTFLATLATRATAEPTAADRATARSLAREGFEALKTDNFEVAEDRFRRADELVHAPTLVVDHARALVGLGRLVEAHERYSLVLREGVSPNAAWPWKRAYADAQKEIEVIKQRLAWLTIEVVGPDKPQVSVDGKPIPAAAVGVRRATDPGDRTVKASAAGYYPKEAPVVLAEGAEQSVRLELEAMPPEVLAETPAEATPAAAGQGAQNGEPSASAEPGPDNTLAYVALGIGGAGLVAWGVTGVLFLQENKVLKNECVNYSCKSPQQEHVDNYNTLGVISGVAFGVGVAGVATGVTLLLLNNDSSTSQAQTKTVRVSPYFAGNSAGVTGRF